MIVSRRRHRALEQERDELAAALDRTLTRAETDRQRARTAAEQTDRLRTEVDDLLVRILETTLEVGRIAQVDLRDTGRPDYYYAEDVDRLLDTARAALGAADELARHATLRRRLLARGLPPETIDGHAAASALRRIERILTDAARAGDASPGRVHALEIVDRAAAEAIDLLRFTLEELDPTRPDPSRLP